MAKNAETQKKRQNNNPQNNNRQNNNMPPNPHMNGGRKPLPPPAVPTSVPKEEPKKSILDRIVKPGDKGKVITKTPDNAIVLNSTKQEKIIKKVKPNPEIR